MKGIVSSLTDVPSGSLALYVVMLSLATIGLLPMAFADDAKDAFEQAKLAAEIEFSETIVQAKAEYDAVISDPGSTSEQKLQAREHYNSIVADAKELRDQKIDDARQEYENAQNFTDEQTLAHASQELSSAIAEAQHRLQEELVAAENDFEELLSKLQGDDEAVEALEESYEQTIEQIHQRFNDAVLSAQQTFNQIKESLSGGASE